MRELIAVVLDVLVIVFGFEDADHAFEIREQQTQKLIDFGEILHVLKALRVLAVAAAADEVEGLTAVLKLEGAAEGDEDELERVFAFAQQLAL